MMVARPNFVYFCVFQFSIMEYGLQLREKIHGLHVPLNQGNKRIMNDYQEDPGKTPARSGPLSSHSNSSLHSPRFGSPRSPFQPLDQQSLLPLRRNLATPLPLEENMISPQSMQRMLATPEPMHRNSALKPVDRKLATPHPRGQGPRMGCEPVACMPSVNALVALQAFMHKTNKTPSKRKSIDSVESACSLTSSTASITTAPKVRRRSSGLSQGLEAKENISTKSDTPSTRSRKSLRRFSTSSKDSLSSVNKENISTKSDNKENISTKSDTPSTRSKKSLRRFSAGSKDSLKKLLQSPKRKSMPRTLDRNPVLTNGILIRGIDGELIGPPPSKDNNNTKFVRKGILSDSLEEASCSLVESSSRENLGPRTCGDGEETTIDNNTPRTYGYDTIELSKNTFVHDTYAQIDKMKYKTVLTDAETYAASPMVQKNAKTCNHPVTKTHNGSLVNQYVTTAVQNCIPETDIDEPSIYYKPVGDQTLSGLSFIGKVTETTIREQPSMNLSGGDVLHSTFQYPLHSTMMFDTLPSIAELPDNTEDDSSIMSYCVDSQSFGNSTVGNCNVCQDTKLKRQTGQGELQHPRQAVGLSETDFLFENSCLNDSMDATRGTIANVDDIDQTLVESRNSTPSLDQTTVLDATLCAWSASKQRSKDASRKRRSRSSRKSYAGQRSTPLLCVESDSDKENSTTISTSQNRPLYRHRSVDSTSDTTSSFSMEKKRELKHRMKKFNSSLHQDSSINSIKTLGFF